jgi:hypothetical protein
MTSSSELLHNGPAADIDFDLVRQFVVDAEAANMFTESLTFEAKERRHDNNVAEAVAALSNTDGGIVLVGVKDKGATGEARIVGVPPKDHDSLVANLQNLMPTAMPEIIPVRMPNSDRLVIVLRADADAVLHPVLAAGKALYRVPGHSVPADRQRLLDLIARDAATGSAPATPPTRMTVPTYAWQPMHIDPWPPINHSRQPNIYAGELRAVGGLTLPSRIADRPWIDSRARQAALDVLNNSPLRAARAWSIQAWRIAEARATTLTLHADRTDGSPITVESAAYLNLAGRSLSSLVALRWFRNTDRPEPIPLETVTWMLLSSLVTVATTVRHVAAALNASEPSDIKPFEARLAPSSGKVLDIVDIGPFARDNRDEPGGAIFPAARPRTTELGDLDSLARNWLTYWLLEIGTRNFESWLVNLAVPAWLQPVIPPLAP